MQPRSYISKLLALAGAALILAVALRIGVGPRWFGFYGLATLTVIWLPVLGFIVYRRYKDLSLSRWPVLAVLLPIGLAALIQIGFWATFFASGPDGIMLAAGRSMVLPLIEPYLPVAGATLAILIAWVVARGAVKRES